MTDGDAGPFPSMLVPNTFTSISVEGGQSDEDASNTWLQTLLSQEEARMVAEPQLLPEVESE